MSDIRTALPKSVGWRLQGSAGAYVTTTRLGQGTSITPADPTEEFQTGFQRPVGAGYNINIEVKDPALFAAVNTDQLALLTYEFLITYAGSRTVLIEDVGFTAVKMRQGSIGIFEGFVIAGFGYGADSDDLITLTPVIS